MNGFQDLSWLKKRVEEELNTYIYSVPPGAIGNPWSSSRVEESLALMRRSLVEPYAIEVRMERPFTGPGIHEIRHCAVVADAKDGYLLVFDAATNEFLLAQFFNDAILSIGVRGDAVGCFMAR
jgi:hypothetical protein